MTQGFDSLLNFLIDNIALKGDLGAQYQELIPWIHEFYSDSHALSGQDDLPLLLFKPLPPTVDTKFCSTVWNWLLNRDDIVKRGLPSTALEGLSGEISPKENDDHGVSNNSAPSTPENSGRTCQHPKITLFAPEEYIWHAIAGHEIDSKRIPPLHFQLLSIIAAHGKNGICQPDLNQISGQDKRSVPKRTDDLDRNGYIEKRSVVQKDKHALTSLCTLTKFVDQSPNLSNSWNDLLPEELRHEIFYENKHVNLTLILDSVIGIARDREYVTTAELRERLGVASHLWERKLFMSVLRRILWMKFITVGCVLTKSHDKSSFQRSIQHLRDPTSQERADFSRHRSSQNRNEPRDNEEADLFELENDEDGFGASDVEDEGQMQEGAVDSGCWQSDEPFQNQFFSVIAAAGVAGITSSDLRSRLGLNFYKRATELNRHRLTELWEKSQPSSLRHLAVIRDVTVDKKSRIYLYRSLSNFELAVKNGETSWHAVGGEHKPKELELDEWGFPELNANEFLSAQDFISSSSKEVNSAHEDGRLASDASLKNLNTTTFSQNNAQTQRKASAKHPRKRLFGSEESPAASLNPNRPWKRPRHLEDDIRTASNTIPADLELDASEAAGHTHSLSWPDQRPKRKRTFKDDNDVNVRVPNRKSQKQALSLGLHMNPFGRFRKRGSGRPPKNPILLAVVKLKRLNEFPWFEDGTARLVSPAESGTQAHQSVQENEAMSAGIPPEMQETIDEIWNVQDEADLQVENHIQNEHEILVTPGYETTQLDTERDRPQENLAARINSNLTQGTATPCSHDMDTAIAEQLPERRSSEDEHSVQQSGSLTTFQPSVENYFTALENNDATLGDPPTTHEGYNPLTSTAALEGENDIAPEHLHSFSTPESVLGVSENSNGIPLEHMNPAASEWRNSISLEDHDHAVSESSHAVASEVVENQDALIGHGQFGSSKYGWRSSQYRNLGHLNEERHGIILDIIEQAGGVYPGGKELWWAYGSRIRASKGDAGKCPDSTTVKRSVMSLANLGIIRIFTFHIDTFSHSKLVQKIVALSSVTEDDERVANLQREMRKSYPQSFFPEEVPIDPQWRYKAGQKSLSTHIQDGKWGDPRWMNLISTQDNGSVQETQPLNRSAWARWRDDILLEHEVTKIEERAREEMFPEEAEMHTRFKVSLPAENLTAAVEIGMTEPYPEQIVFSGSHAEERIPLTEPSMPKPSPLKSIAPKSFHRKRYNKEQREYVKIIRLFTHPLQSFHRPSGTFSTEYFSEGKKLPFSLSIDTGAPGRFDSEMPQDLSDLLARHSSHGDQSMRPYDVCAEFDRVQDWELENVELLTQGKELGQLRFINHLHISSSIRIEDVVNHSEILALDSTIPASSREQMFGEIEQVASWEMNYLSIFVSHQKLNEFRFINHRVNPSATPWPSLPSITSTSIQETEILSLTRPPLSISATRALKARKGFDGTSLPRKYRRLTDSRRESTRVSCENYPTAINRPSRSSPATQPSTRLIEKFQQQKRSTNDRFPFTELETQRFIVVVGATRILAGGIAKSINWVLVGRYLDHGLQELPLAAGWKMVNQNRKSKVQAFDNAFPDAYVDAYEAGLVPSVDFNDIFRTDWEEIFQWAMTSIPELKQYRRPLPTSMSLQKELSRKNFKLPDSKTELEIGFEKSWVLTPFGRTEFFKSRLNDSETRDLLAAFPFEVTSQSKYQPSSEEASVDKAKTFIRANLNTPAHRLNRKQAKKILSRLPDETVDVALQSLRSENAVHQQRSSLVRSSGHRYRMSHFLGKLMRESPFVGDAEHFQQAMRFKKAMDTAFNLDEATLVPSTASMAVSGSLADGETAVLLSLVAASHIDISLDFVENELSPENDDGLADLDPIQANKITKWGIEYKVSRTATLDQGRIQFPMYIRPTASYVSGLPPIENYSWAAPMTDDEAIEGWEDGVPVWQDLMGNPLENIWRILVVFIVYFLVFYPYSTTTNVTLAFGQTSAMQEWEVEVILKWLECRGVIKQASSESWMTTEWWWCIFGEEGWRLSSAV